METFDLSIGLGTADPCLLDRRPGPSARSVPESGAVAGAVVGEDSLNLDSVVGVKGGGTSPEGGSGQNLLVVVDLGVDEASTVVDGGVQVAVAGPRMTLGRHFYRAGASRHPRVSPPAS